MAILHQMLTNYTKTDIDIDKYIKQITSKIIKSYNLKNLTINSTVSTKQIFTPDDMVNIGLIINEIITNSTKHAFLKNSVCKVDINVYDSDGFFFLEICDNGIGYPKQLITNHSSNGIGMMIVEVLSKQLNATLELKNKNGACFLMKTPLL